MKYHKIKILLLLLLAINVGVGAQTQTGPPPEMAAPNESNKILIDQLVEVSGIKEFFLKYCQKAIDSMASKGKWDQSKIIKKKGEINFDDFKRVVVYNSFAELNSDELKMEINVFESLKKRGLNKEYFLLSSIIMINMPNFVRRYF